MTSPLSHPFTERVHTHGWEWAKAEPYRAAMVADKLVKLAAYTGLVGLAIASRLEHTGFGKVLGGHLSSLGNMRFVFWAVRFGVKDISYFGELRSTWRSGGTDKTPNKLGAAVLGFLVAFELCNISNGALKTINYWAQMPSLARYADFTGKGASITLFGLITTDLADSMHQRYVNTGKAKAIVNEADNVRVRRQVFSDTENMLEFVNFSIEEGMTQFPGMEWVGLATAFASGIYNLGQRKHEFDLYVLKKNEITPS